MSVLTMVQDARSDGGGRLAVTVQLRALVPGRIGGIENVTRDLLDALAEERGNHLVVTALTGPAGHDEVARWRGVHRVRAAPPDAAFWRRQHVLWCPLMFLAPSPPPVPAVTSIPDLQHLAHPEFFAPDELARRATGIRVAVHRSARVLVPSDFTARHMQRAYELPSERVVVLPHGCSPDLCAPVGSEVCARVLARWRLRPGYLLYPARAWPHKNHVGLLRGLARHRALHGSAPRLVLTGADDLETSGVAAHARALGVADLVHSLGTLPQRDLAALYDGAAAVVVPSLFEGFGLPALEAMQRGVPLAAAQMTSLPEVAGDAAVWFDPASPASIAAAIRAATRPSAATRQRVDRGRRRAARFSYRAAARTLARVLLDAAGVPPAEPLAAAARRWRPRVFVVTPSLNQAAYLPAAIESVLAQDYPDLEYAVADGGSTDATLRMLESYGDRVRWWSAPDGGHAAAITAALRASRAEVVAWLNSDDTYRPGAVRAAVDALARHPEAAMVYGEADYTDAAGVPIGRYPTRPRFSRTALAGNCFVCQPATFLRREVFDVIDLPDPSLRYAFDYDLWIRFATHYDAVHLDRVLATYRLHSAAKTVAQRDGIYDEVLRVARRHFGYVHHEWLAGYLHHRCSRLARRVPWIVPRPLARVLASWRMRRHRVKVPAPPYGDGWAGPLTTLLVDGDAARVRVIGESPFWPFPRRLVVRAQVAGREVGRCAVRRRGRFSLEVSLPQRRLTPTVVTLAANRAFVPASAGVSDDCRALAFRVLSVETVA